MIPRESTSLGLPQLRAIVSRSCTFLRYEHSGSSTYCAQLRVTRNWGKYGWVIWVRVCFASPFAKRGRRKLG